jgi:cysteine desulfurase
MQEALCENYGNPSSLHRKGYEAEKIVQEARRKLAEILRVDPMTLYFTSCATESTNTALRGAAKLRHHQGKHILTSKGEHAATRETLQYLKTQGFEIDYLENDATGRILLDDLEQKLREDTILVTCLHVNNETGCIQPVREMAERIHRYNPAIFFHVDAVQSFGKLPVYPAEWGIDLVSTSAHKVNGPKGVGFLYVRRGIALPPLLYGGGQEKHLRSGTENVAGIVGFAEAADQLWKMREVLQPQMLRQKVTLYRTLTESVEGIVSNGPQPEDGAAHILSLQVDRVRSEVLLHALEDYGIYISSGSACSSNKPAEKSPTLASIGKTTAEIDTSVRISFGRYTTEEEIEECVRAMKEIIPNLRRFTRK